MTLPSGAGGGEKIKSDLFFSSVFLGLRGYVKKDILEFPPQAALFLKRRLLVGFDIVFVSSSAKREGLARAHVRVLCVPKGGPGGATGFGAFPV